MYSKLLKGLTKCLMLLIITASTALIFSGHSVPVNDGEIRPPADGLACPEADEYNDQEGEDGMVIITRYREEQTETGEYTY